MIQIQRSRQIAGVLQLHTIPELSLAFLRSNLASHFRSDDMVTLGRDRTEACRRRKYFLLDNIFLEVAKQLRSKSPHRCTLFFLSLSFLFLCVCACILCTDVTSRIQQCSVFVLLLSEFFLLLFFLYVDRTSSNRQHLEFNL